MRALWLHAGSPRALQNLSCSLPCGLAGQSLIWSVGFMGFVCLVHCLAAGGSHHRQPVLDHRILHCECADLPQPLPAGRVPSTPREQKGMMWALRLKCPSQASILQCCDCKANPPYTQSIPLGITTQAMGSFIDSQLFIKGQPRARHYRLKDWVRREKKDVVSSKWFYYKGDTCQHTSYA